MPKIEPEPSQEDIAEVIKATGCTRTRARIFLTTNGNSVEKAVEQLHSHRKSLGNLKSEALSSTSRPPIPQPISQGTSSVSAKTPVMPGRIHSSEERPNISSPLSISNQGKGHPPVSSTKNVKPISFTPTTSSSVTDGFEGDQTNLTPDPPQSLDNRAQDAIGRLKASDMSGLADQSADNALWDLILPSLKNAGPLGPSGSDGLETFSVRHLVAAVQHGATANEVNAYISHFSTQHKATVQAQINSDVEGFPAIFYIVGSNDDSIIRAFDKAGADLHATYGDPPVPLLAFAVINSKIIGRDTSSTIATLLSLGADEKSIPKPFYSPFDVDHPEDGPQEEIMLEYLQDARTAWYKRRSTRKLLSEALSITQRYYLYRASQLSKPTGRQKDVAARHSSTELFAIPYFLIGQNAATELLTRSFLRYMLRRQKHPLVLVFAGPSGHGKTELARRLGDLLSLDLNVSDCTIVTRELELFGPRKPYSGAAEGSPLNNFLAAHHGRKCIVFLDEFEKTTQDIWNALLVPFDNGEYQDRRNLKTIDCKNTIWILATNALDNCITSFCKRNGAIFGTDNSTTRAELLDELTSSMKEKFINVFSAPLTGRISAFVPFLPFSSEETCIGAHKYLLELANEVRKPICITPGPHEHLLGNIRLSIRADATVCKIITRDYDPALGIRSLRKAVTDRVASLLDSEYLATHEIIAEGGPVEDYSVFVSDGKIKVKQISSRPDHA